LENERAGEALAAPGDVDDDGFEDVVVGAFTRTDVGDHGAAFVVLGGSALDGEHLLDADAHLRIEGENAEDTLGDDVEGAGDVDGDELPDIVVSATRSQDYDSPAPRIYLLRSPPPSGVVSAGELDAAILGTPDGIGAGIGDFSLFATDTLASEGDTDGDGVPELLIGCPRLSTDLTYAGGAYLVEGFPF
jgi:hypothetical protein